MNAKYVILSVALFLNSCHVTPGTSETMRHYVFILDGTASIVPASFDQAMHAIEMQGAQLHRGDCISVVPIVGDSDAVASGQIVRKCVPTERQPYDQELTDFQIDLHQMLAAQSRQLTQNRAAKTDILGTIQIAEQEFALDGPSVQRNLLIFSDFIEEDGARNFVTLLDLSTPELAERLARTIAVDPAPGCSKPLVDWSRIHVFLGSLQSTETPKLQERRRESIRRFWIAYFTALHTQPFYAADGPGMSSTFLARQQ
jgi:hypothetical protein